MSLIITMTVTTAQCFRSAITGHWVNARPLLVVTAVLDKLLTERKPHSSSDLSRVVLGVTTRLPTESALQSVQ